MIRTEWDDEYEAMVVSLEKADLLEAVARVVGSRNIRIKHPFIVEYQPEETGLPVLLWESKQGEVLGGQYNGTE